MRKRAAGGRGGDPGGKEKGKRNRGESAGHFAGIDGVEDLAEEEDNVGPLSWIDRYSSGVKGVA